MQLWAAQCVCLLLAAALGVDEPLPVPPLKGAPVPLPAVPLPEARVPAVTTPSAKKPRHFVVQLKLVEVDEQGRETLLGEPKLKTTGGNAGISIDHPDGRRFEFTVRLTDRLGSGDELAPAKTMASSQIEDIRKKLDRRIDLNVLQQPRKDVLREISRRAGVSIAIDPQTLKELLAQLELPIDVKVNDEPASAVLDRVIEPLKLAYAIKHDVVLIATAEKLAPAPDELVVKTYDVADLVKINPDRELPDFDPLIERIKTSVMAASWERKEATIRPFNSTLSIVVRQTSSVHGAIERLLEKVRREQPMTIPE